MPTMQEILASETTRARLIDDCTQLIDDEVQKKSGLSGVAIKTGYKVVKGLKPGAIREATDKLIDDFGKHLQPLADEAKEKNLSIATYFDQERSRVADAMLRITDDRAEKATHKIVKGSYLKLRPTAKKHVEEAAAGVGKLVEKHTGG